MTVPAPKRSTTEKTRVTLPRIVLNSEMIADNRDRWLNKSVSPNPLPKIVKIIPYTYINTRDQSVVNLSEAKDALSYFTL